MMMIFFFNEEGFLFQHIVYQNHTVTAVYYQEVLQKKIAHLKKKHPQKKLKKFFASRQCLPHVAYTVTAFLEKRSIETVLQPPYTPDLALCDSWLFPEIKKSPV